MYKDDIDKLDRERLPKRRKCPRCPKTFQSYNDLIKHAKKIHGMSDIELNFEGYSKIIHSK